MQIFISHSSKNGDVAKRVCTYLEEKGEKCFLAPRDIRPGKEYAEEIINGIDSSQYMVLLISKEANSSPHVLREVERAVSKSIPILVYKLEEVELSKSLEYFLMTHQWFDAKMQGDYEELWRAVKDEDRPTAKQRSVLALVLALVCVCLAGVCVWNVYHKNKIPEVSYRLGDTLSFGSYLDVPIEWRILHLSEDGTEAVMISKDIITMKAFDAPESGSYNQDGEEDYWMRDSLADTDLELQRRVRGDNTWSKSNIRTWLNSAEEVVTYADYPPRASAMSEKKNGYHNEAGFLQGFTEQEREAILPTGEDKVFLLSLEELKWFDEAGMSKLAVPTEMAVEQDQSAWYRLQLNEYDIKEYSWWLRQPVEDTSSMCYLVGNGYYEENIQKANVGLEGYGIRPAVRIDLGRMEQ